MKYKVVVKRYDHDLEIEVNKLINKGWLPLGGVSLSAGPGYCATYGQAMVFGGKE